MGLDQNIQKKMEKSDLLLLTSLLESYIDHGELYLILNISKVPENVCCAELVSKREIKNKDAGEEA